MEVGHVHVWYARVPVEISQATQTACLKLLTSDERARMERFAFENLKREFLVTRMLCRTTLSRYSHIEPREWRFSPNDYGRPEISNSEAPRWLKFNLSNVRSMVVCAVTRDVDIGIDIESLDRADALMDIAEHYFAKSELEGLLCLDPALRRRRFFELWTLKESYIKARGMGLSIPLEKFAFEFDSSRVRVIFDPLLADREGDWQFDLLQPDERHLIALGLRHGRAHRHQIRLAEALPLDLVQQLVRQ